MAWRDRAFYRPDIDLFVDPGFPLPAYSSYIICGTPRSGSTMLCEMLAATGVAGRPNSYFRQQSFEHWADRWGVPHPDGVDNAAFDRAFLAAMLREGSNGTGIFGIRIMWVSIAEASRRLDRLNGAPGDVTERFKEAFGLPLYIHLSREDKVAQAISRLRAEQSGLWHVASDGSTYEGVAIPAPTRYDGARIKALYDELHGDEAGWEAFFATHGIAPLRLTYNTMTANPQGALAGILAALGRDPEIARTVSVRTSKMGDGTSREWADRFRREYGLEL